MFSSVLSGIVVLVRAKCPVDVSTSCCHKVCSVTSASSGRILQFEDVSTQVAETVLTVKKSYIVALMLGLGDICTHINRHAQGIAGNFLWGNIFANFVNWECLCENFIREISVLSNSRKFSPKKVFRYNIYKY